MQVWLKSIHSFKRYGADKPFSNNLSPPVTLKMKSRSPKSNQHFSHSQWYICVSLAKICPINQEIECGQETTPTPTGYALKTICPPPWWRDINSWQSYRSQDKNYFPSEMRRQWSWKPYQVWGNSPSSLWGHAMRKYYLQTDAKSI